MEGLHADVHAPKKPGPYPLVTLTYGGGWSSGNRTQMSPLADYLASSGMVAINADYLPLSEERHLLHLVQEVACIAAAAPTLAQPYLTGPAGPVWMLGFSAGAHLTALAALSDDILPWACPNEPTEIAGVIGLGGPYEAAHVWRESTIATKMPEGADWLRGKKKQVFEFYGRSLLANVPENLWHFLDPVDIGFNHSPLRFLFLAGGADEIAPPFYSEALADSLTQAGHQVSLQIIPDKEHMDLAHPQTVGERIVSFLTHPRRPEHAHPEPKAKTPPTATMG